MSDFDTVLELLVTDPAFTSALAADPAAALSGYDLSDDEVQLLRSQVNAGDSGGERTVEIRTSKAGMMGLLSPLGLGGGDPTLIGRGVAHVDTGFESLHDAPARWVGPGDSGMGSLGGPPDTGLTDLDGHYGPTVVPVGEGGHYGASVDTGHYGATPGAMPRMDSLLGPGDHLATDYHPHIDADGDGKWDHYVAVRHADGSVDVYEDRNGDGVADFVGHDRNGDGVLESADYDHAFDGTADTHMADTDGDGWMDTRTPENGLS